MTQEELLSVAEIIERLVKRFEEQGAEHARKLAEHRASFGARTEADRLIIEGLRAIVKEQSDHAKDAGTLLGWAPNESAFQAAQRVVKERDGLLTQVQDQRAEFASALSERDALRVEVAALQERLRASIARGDFAEIEVAQLKAQTPKRSHPVAVGGYLRRLTGFCTTPAGEVAQVLHVDCDGPATEYTIKRPNGQQGVWSESGCEPCDPPADHDTPAGKEAAESAAAEIKVGDVVEVVSATHKIYTEPEDIGRRGVVTAIDGMRISVEAVPCYELPIGGIVGKCDVRKEVTT